MNTISNRGGTVPKIWATMVLVSVIQLIPHTQTIAENMYRKAPNFQAKNEVVLDHSDLGDVRLPQHLVPISYKLRLLPIIQEGNFTFTGSVTIELRALVEGRNITVHSKQLHIFRESIIITDLTENVELAVENCSYDTARDFIIIHTGQLLQENHFYEVSINFSGSINEHLSGFYRSSYTDSNGNKQWLAVTQFEPTDARKAFPCLDEPALKAVFNVTIGRKRSMKAISNMPLLRTAPIESLPDYVWDTFEATVPMSTYLLAYVISDFDYRSAVSNNGEFEFRVWAQPSAIDQTDYALGVGPAVLSYFESFFQTPFPLPKQDMVAIPDFSAGAMENWGLITFKETNLLWDGTLSSVFDKFRVAIVISHELAHQWFGNLVTPDWWSDLWLNEGFATYMEYVGVDHVEPEWDSMNQLIRETRLVMEVDSLESTHQVSIPVSSPQEIGEIFDEISYKKGAVLINMMNSYLTTNTIQKGLANYLHVHKYKATDQNHLWNELTLQAHEDNTLPVNFTVKTIMDTWTLQKGYPIVHVDRNYSSCRALVTQKRFMFDRSDNSGNLWWIPLTIITKNISNSADQLVWMSTENVYLDNLPSADDWILVNHKQAGYYRVNYDIGNWHMIIDQLLHDHTVINQKNRAQIIDDSFQLARSQHLPYSIVFSMLKYLKHETEYLPWDAVFSNLQYLENQLRAGESYAVFTSFVLKLIESQSNMIDFSRQSSDSFNDHLHRMNVLKWACRVNHGACIHRSRQLFTQWMRQPQNNSIIANNVKSVVYCTAMREGGTTEWTFAVQQYKHAHSSSEQVRLIEALGCTRDPLALQHFLNILLDTESWIRTHDGVTVLTSVTTSAEGADIMWNFLVQNLTLLAHKYAVGSFAMPKIVAALKNNFNTPAKLAQLESFVTLYRNQLTSAQRGIEQLLEVSRNDVKWNEKLKTPAVDSMLTYLHQHNTRSTL